MVADQIMLIEAIWGGGAVEIYHLEMYQMGISFYKVEKGPHMNISKPFILHNKSTFTLKYTIYYTN